MAPPVKAALVPATYPAAVVARAHTYLGLTAFLTALVLGCALHYEKIVKNGVAGYPEEWFPSVSATIGDWYPERNVFQILIALTSGARFVLVWLQYQMQSAQGPDAYLPGFVFWVGILRTFSCGGWVYVPSYEAHTFHDVAMVAYIVLNIPWMFGGLACSNSVRGRNRRRLVGGSFFAALVPLVYFFIQHKVHRIPGAYTYYAFFEWSLIFLDVLYDGITEIEFKDADFQVCVGMALNQGFNGSGRAATDEMPSEAAEQPADPSRAQTEKPAADLAGVSNNVGSTSTPANSTSAASVLLSRLLAPSKRPEWVCFASDLYLSYIFWTMYTILVPSFFYYSVWQLGVAGHELTLLTTLSPCLLGIPPILHWARSRNGRAILWASALVGIASYATRYPIIRMVCVGVANACLVMVKAVDWSSVDNAAYEGLLLVLGLVLSSLSKHANHSNNPVWPIVNEKSGGWNKTGFALAALAMYELYTRPVHHITEPPATGKTAPQAGAANVDAPATKSAAKTAAKVAARPAPRLLPPISSWLPASLALGSLVFGLHTFLADSSTLVAWSWTGYPIKGPVPHLHGSITLAAQAAGALLFLALWRTALPAPAEPLDATATAKVQAVGPAFSTVHLLLASPLWYAAGSTGAYVLYTYKDWTGYLGGVVFAVFLSSIVPLVLQRAAAAADARGPAMVFFAAWLAVTLLDFFHVLTVAYAFVPGGQYLRERTDLVMLAHLALLAPVFRWPGVQVASPGISLGLPRTASYSRTVLALTTVLAVAATIYRLPSNSPRPYRSGPRIVRAGIWTVHFGIDDEGRDSQRRMRDLIKDMELDIVGLLETDLHRIAYGNRDLTRVIAEDLGYYVDLGPGPNQHTWGAVLLSKFPIINSTHHLLPSPGGELAPAIQAFLDIYGKEVMVIVSHNGQEEDPLDRELQATELARLMASTFPDPVIFLGYVVTKPQAKRPNPYEIMVTDGKVHDVDEFDWDRWCEYIMYRGLYRTAYARVSRATITDTELQVGQFVVPEYNSTVTDDSHEARYLRSFKEMLPEEHWFPMEYYGDENEGGVRGHFYHVFGTPLYYRRP